MSKRAWIAVLAAVVMIVSAAPALRAQGEALEAASFGKGRIVQADGTKIRVASFALEANRVSYRLEAAAEPAFLDLAKVGALQVRKPTTFLRVGRSFLLLGAVGGVIALMAADQWGGPGSNTWPGIGAAALLCGAVGVALELSIPRYETVYSNPDVAPKKIIKLTLGPLSPRSTGLSIACHF